MLEEIKTKEKDLTSMDELLRDTKYQEQCDEQNLQHKQRVKSLDAFAQEMIRLNTLVRKAQDDVEREKLLGWLSKVDPSTTYNSARRRHGHATSDWLVKEDTTFMKWVDEANSLLWLHGKGKCIAHRKQITL